MTIRLLKDSTCAANVATVYFLNFTTIFIFIYILQNDRIIYIWLIYIDTKKLKNRTYKIMDFSKQRYCSIQIHLYWYLALHYFGTLLLDQGLQRVHHTSYSDCCCFQWDQHILHYFFCYPEAWHCHLCLLVEWFDL